MLINIHLINTKPKISRKNKSMNQSQKEEKLISIRMIQLSIEKLESNSFINLEKFKIG